MNTASEKSELRTACLAARQARADTSPIWDISTLRVAGPVRTVAGYVPVGSEPGAGLPELLAAAFPDAEVLLPVLRPDLDLDWARYEGPASLVAAARRLREPQGERRGITAIAAAQLVVVPALAVDRRGMRLGRGGGSYDRALARVSPSALVAALLYDGEILEHVPDEPHDRPVDVVLTPSGAHYFADRA